MVDFSDTPQMAAFREQVRAFVQQHHPKALADEGQYSTAMGGAYLGQLSEEERERLVGQWREALVNRRWIAPAWPEEYGGANLSVMEQFVLNEEFAALNATPVPIRQDAGMTLILYSIEEQKREYLPRMVQGERWCQGYSEPGAGSDLASLQTRAIRDGDEFVLNGQKIWTSGAHRAQMMFGLFRTDPEAPKHRGISYLLVPMNTPGVTTRQIEQMTGLRDFNEVFFEDARVPAKNLVGELNRGWYIGATLLDFERSNIGSAVSIRKTLDQLRELVVEAAVRDRGRSRLRREPAVRATVADRYVEGEVARLFSARVFTMQHRGQVPNYEASVSKVFTSELKQRIGNTAVKALGLYGQLAGKENPYAPMRSKWEMYYLSAVTETIGAGTSEIQRNVIATRGLGLPRG